MGCSSSSTRSQFQNGEPADFKAKKVVPCFAGRGNGLLFRLEDADGRWAYYNDTTKYDMRVSVHFHADSKIEALGDAIVSDDEDGGKVVTVVVPPLATVLMVSGKVNGFKAKMAAYLAGQAPPATAAAPAGSNPVDVATEEEAQSDIEKPTPKA